MKKLVSLIIAAVMCLSVFVGCGTSSVDLNEVVNKINSDYSLSLEKLSSADDLNTYYSIESADVKQFAAEMDSTNDAPKEIVLIEAVDSAAADRVEQALTTRYNSIYQTYSSYSPEQLDMVKNCKVTKDGNYVSLIVATDAEDMLEIYYGYIK